MTSPNVGTAEVEIVASMKAFAASLRKEVEASFKGLDFDKLIRQSVSARPVKVPVEPDVKTDQIPAKIRAARAPKVPVEVDPVLGAFQNEVRAKVRALARTVNANIPVGADTAGLRAELSAALVEVQRSSRVEVPTEPGSRAVYEAKLKAQLAEVSHRVKQQVKVDVDGGGGGLLSRLQGLLRQIPGVNSLTSALGALGSVVGGVGSFISTLSGAFGSVVSAVTSFLTVIGAVFSALVILPAAASAAAGALAAIPAALVGAGAGVATLLLGFKGIGAALDAKPKSGGGGGGGQNAAQQARQIAAASRQVEAARRGIASANRAYEASERSLAAAQRGTVQAQRALVDAEQGVVKAQQQERLAQIAVGQARREAADDLTDLNLQLRGSRLSEQEATLAVTDALRELNAVRLTGNIPEIQKADLAYQRAQQSLDEATQSTKELQKKADDANSKGVEGSDKVQEALRAQADATDGVRKAQEGVVDAQNGVLDAADSLKSAEDGVISAQDGMRAAADGLKSAQDGLAQAQTKQATAGAAAAATLTKLAPSAEKFVGAIKALKPAFDNLRLDVQQRLFAGLDDTVTHMWSAWKDQLHITLGSFADTFNGFFKDFGKSVSTPTFISDIAAGAEGARQGLSDIGSAITKYLVPAFGDLVRAAGPFLEKVGGWIAEAVKKFSEWVEDANKSGKLQDFFDHAATAFHDIGTTGTLVLQIIGDVIGIIIGANQTGGGKSPLESFNDGLKKVHEWLQDPDNQAKIQGFIDDVKDVAGTFKDAANKVDHFVGRIHNFADKVEDVRKKIRGFFYKLFGLDENGNAKEGGKSIGESLVDGLKDGLKHGLKDIGNWIAGLLWSGPDSLIGRIKSGLGIASPSTVMMEIGGDLIEGLIKGIGDSLQALGNFVLNIPTTVKNALGNAGSWLKTHGQQAISGLGKGMSSAYGWLKTTAGNARTTVSNALSNAGSWLHTHGQQVISGLGAGITSMFGSLRTWVGGAKGWIQSALSGAANWLITHGQNVVIGLWNGIVSKGTWLYNKLIGWAKSVIPGPIAQALGIASPSKVAHKLGTFVGQGLADGIASQTAHVSAAADAIAAAAVPHVDATFGVGGGLSAALSTSLESATQQQLVLSWANGASADPLMRALQTLINVQYRGSVQAAFTGSG